MAVSIGAAIPAVSVVIPTFRRPELLVRAVSSVLAQTWSDLEVVVVVDGPDDATGRALAHVADPRVRVRQLASNRGLGGAICAGVERARARWVALLDDDDEWLPRKLELQLAHAGRSRCAHPVVSCRFIARSEGGDLIWPRRLPDQGEPPSEYFFSPRSLRGGDAVVLPSSILTTRDLLERVPWRAGLPRLNDYDWLLRALREPDAALECVEHSEPLAVYHRDESRSRLSNSADWQYLRSWIQDNQELVTPRARAGFLLTQASLTAARARDKRAFFLLLSDAFRAGRPTLTALAAHFAIWTIPSTLRTRLAIASGGARKAPPRWLGDSTTVSAPEVRRVCDAILSGSEDPRVAPIRAETGKRSFRVVLPSGPAKGILIVKEYGPRGPLDATLLRHMRPVPGVRVPRAVEAIGATGVLTPRLRFAMSVTDGRGPRQLVGIEEINQAQTLRQVLGWLPRAPRADFFRLLGNAIARIHAAGVFHFDLNEDNLLYRCEPGRLVGPYFVDLDYTVQTAPRRKLLCRILARLDIHQLLTIRNARITRQDRRALETGYDPGPEPTVAWNLEIADLARDFRPDGLPPLPRKPYPRWKRSVATTCVHLFRGLLLVARLVR